ncbi:MAG: helix-turn-helix domain-containing protein [Candidatus Anstonellaceae archaeon]
MEEKAYQNLERRICDAGLSMMESRTYLALVQLGPSPASSIIRLAGMHKATVYQALQSLIEKGLVSFTIEGKRKVFRPAEPRLLLEKLAEKESSLEQALPDLERIYKAHSLGKQQVSVYVGKEGIRSVLNSMIREIGPGGFYCDFGVSGLFRKVMGSYFTLWQKLKRKKKITSYVIFNEKLRKDKEFFKEYFGKARFYPEKYESLTDTMIYNDTVILLIWTAKPPLAIVIKSKENAKSYLNQFWLMWEKAKP